MKHSQRYENSQSILIVMFLRCYLYTNPITKKERDLQESTKQRCDCYYSHFYNYHNNNNNNNNNNKKYLLLLLLSLFLYFDPTK